MNSALIPCTQRTLKYLELLCKDAVVHHGPECWDASYALVELHWPALYHLSSLADATFVHEYLHSGFRCRCQTGGRGPRARHSRERWLADSLHHSHFPNHTPGDTLGVPAGQFQAVEPRRPVFCHPHKRCLHSTTCSAYIACGRTSYVRVTILHCVCFSIMTTFVDYKYVKEIAPFKKTPPRRCCRQSIPIRLALPLHKSSLWVVAQAVQSVRIAVCNDYPF